jgi:hypothetical protein
LPCQLLLFHLSAKKNKEANPHYVGMKTVKPHRNTENVKKSVTGWVWWYTPVIPAPQEAE